MPSPTEQVYIRVCHILDMNGCLQDRRANILTKPSDKPTASISTAMWNPRPNPLCHDAQGKLINSALVSFVSSLQGPQCLHLVLTGLETCATTLQLDSKPWTA